MGSPSFGRCIVLSILTLIIALLISYSAIAQGLRQSPYSAPNVLRGTRSDLDLGPSNPLSAPMAGLVGPREQSSILFSPNLFQGILPNIPNLQFGYLYRFGSAYARSNRLSVDYLLPITLGHGNSAIFGEAHGEFTNFWDSIRNVFSSRDTITSTSSFDERKDLSFGGGYRTILNENTLIGVNGFFDTTKIGGKWYNSGGLGVEFAALLPGNDAVDLTLNYYGNLFNSDVLTRVFRTGPENYDFQTGYSHELWNGGPDLRLHATGYRFSAGTSVYGYKGGAELKSRDGMFSVKYEIAHDRINKTYHTVGGFVNLGFQLGNLWNGESPFVGPEPIFSSPRNLKRLLVRPATDSRHTGGPNSIITSSAEVDQCITRAVYVMFTGNVSVVYLPSPVKFSDLNSMNTATMVIGDNEAVINPGAGLDYTRLLSNLNDEAMPRYDGPIPGTFPVTRNADPEWFGIGLTGTEFDRIVGRVFSADPNENYHGTITITWCP